MTRSDLRNLLTVIKKQRQKKNKEQMMLSMMQGTVLVRSLLKSSSKDVEDCLPCGASIRSSKSKCIKQNVLWCSYINIIRMTYSASFVPVWCFRSPTDPESWIPKGIRWASRLFCSVNPPCMERGHVDLMHMEEIWQWLSVRGVSITESFSLDFILIIKRIIWVGLLILDITRCTWNVAPLS